MLLCHSWLELLWVSRGLFFLFYYFPQNRKRYILGNLLIFQCVTTLSVNVVNNALEYVIFTWAQCGAGHSLEGRALTECSSIQRGRIGAAACSSLPTPPALSITLWPFSPRRPTSTHWQRDTHRWAMWVRLALNSQVNLNSNKNVDAENIHAALSHQYTLMSDSKHANNLILKGLCFSNKTIMVSSVRSFYLLCYISYKDRYLHLDEELIKHQLSHLQITYYHST